MNRKTVKLVQPIEHFGKRIAEVELREPPTKQFLEFGEPRTPIFSPTGTVYYVETPGVFEKYLDYCISSPEEGYTCYIKLGFEDAREVKGNRSHPSP